MTDNITESSVQTRKNNYWKSTIMRLAAQYDIIPEWWSPARDAFFRGYWHQENFLASAIYAIANRNAAFGWELTGIEQDVNRSQQLLQFAEFGEGWQSLMIKTTIDLLCLHGDSTVILGGDRYGKRKTIKDIVNDKDIGPVLSLDENNQIVEKRITEWYKTGLENRKWMWIRTKNCSYHSGKNKSGLFLTNDHKVLTKDGWKRADELSTNDSVYTGHYYPNESQMEIVVGAMLGDSSMSVNKVGTSAIFRLSQCIKQKEWLETKMNSLDFDWTPVYGSELLGSNSSASFGLLDIYNDWHENGKKIVPIDIVKKYFTPLMLATWYMDDGSLSRTYGRNKKECRPGASLYTNGFTNEEVNLLVSIFNENGFECFVYIYKPKNRNKSYSVIHFNVNGAEKLFRTIAKYIPVSMRYKLPENIYDLDEFDKSLWNVGKKFQICDEIEEVVYRSPKTGYKYESKTTYCIDVEDTHNFIANNIVVHNCQDNGAFVEVIRPAKVKFENVTLPAYKSLGETGNTEWFIDYNGRKEVLADSANIYDSPLDLPIGLAHLDAARCRRTGDSDIPVIYTDMNGKMHALKWWQVLMFNDMPSPIESMNGVGYCALSRLFRASHIMQSISIFNDEKVSGRFNRAVFLTNIDPDTINDAITQAEEDASNLGLIRYSQPIIAATLNPDAVPAVQTINLAEIPTGFDQDNTNSWYISALALALGVDYGFLAPLPGKGLGTASQSETMERQSKGKSSRLFMDMFSNAINFKGILPKSVQFRFTETDTEELERQEKERKARADRFKIYLETGLVTPTIAQQMLSDYGDIDVQYLEQMGQDDTTPIVTQQGDESLEAQTAQDDYSENYEQIEKRKKALFQKPTLVKRLKNATQKIFKTKQIATPEVDNPDLQIALSNYGDELEALTLQANSGEITQAQFEEQLATLVETSLIALYSEMVGKDVTEFDNQDEANLEEYIVVNLDSVKKLSDDIYAGKYEDTEDKDGVLMLLGRLGLWVVNALALSTLGMLNNPEKQEDKLLWTLGGTLDHCATCVALDGQIHSISEWNDSGFYPKNTNLLICNGFNCGCSFSNVDKNTASIGNLSLVPRK